MIAAGFVVLSLLAQAGRAADKPAAEPPQCPFSNTDQIVQTYQPKAAYIIVMDPHTGEIMALVQGDGLGIVDVTTREADLEDVFVKLTSEPATA